MSFDSRKLHNFSSFLRLKNYGKILNSTVLVVSILGFTYVLTVTSVQAYADLQNAGSSLQGFTQNPPNNGSYDRNRAVAWAIANAEDQPPASASCTWFASNVLWQGGLQQTQEWTSQGQLGSTIKGIFYPNLPGTQTAWNAPMLESYLLKSFPSTLKELDFKANTVPEAQPGDLIFYDWGEGEGVSHVSVIVNIAPGQYPEVTEWSPEFNGSLPSPYIKRGWTYSELRHNWLQVKYPNVKAYLLHCNI
jgi:hypothetical protein